jgi:hypothetical protein
MFKILKTGFILKMNTEEHTKDNRTIHDEEDDLSISYDIRVKQTGFFSACLKSRKRREISLVMAGVLIFLLIGTLVTQKILSDKTISELREVIRTNNGIKKPPALNISLFYLDSLESLCDSTRWQPNVYLNCTNVKQMMGWPQFTVNPQGAMNLRNSMLTCVRWAIDGGMGLIMPRIAVRNPEDIIWFDHWEDYSYLFDENGLRATLGEECPQLKIYDTYHKVSKQVNSTAGGFTHYAPGSFRKHVDELIASVPNYSKDDSIVIWENEPLFGFYFDKESKNVHKSLSKAVNFRPDLLAIASVVISLLPKNFVGMHLRCERDTGAYNYSTQVTPMLEMMKQNFTHIDTIYVAVGTPEIEEQFRADMNAHNLKVISKSSLLSSDKQTGLQEKMSNLGFDQQGVIDYQVLIQSDYFFGVGISSFAFGVAFERGRGNYENCNCRLHGGILGEFKCCF